MLGTSYNETQALSALSASVIETRLCVSVKPDDEIYNFVYDSSPLTVDGEDYNPLPYVIFSSITSGDGRAADTMQITLDGQHLVTNDDAWTVDSVFQEMLNRNLRDRPMSVDLAVLNPETFEVIGMVPQFVGFIDNVPLERPKGEPSRLIFNCSSYRAYSQRRVARVHSNSDHQTRFPGDGAAKWLSSVVFRGGKFPWNKTTATSVGTTINLGNNFYHRTIERALR